jgi:hypothetical protein
MLNACNAARGHPLWGKGVISMAEPDGVVAQWGNDELFMIANWRTTDYSWPVTGSPWGFGRRVTSSDA